MGLIQSTLTTEEKQARTRAVLDQHLHNGAVELYNRATQIWTLFWANPHGLSAQQVFDSFGADALEMAKMLNSAKLMIQAIEPDLWQLVRPGIVTPVLGEDGQPTGYVTVTMGDS